MNVQIVRRLTLFTIILLLIITACNQNNSIINQNALLISTTIENAQRIEAISIETQQVSHILDVPSYALLYLSPDGQRLAVWAGKTLTIVDTKNGEPLIELSKVGQSLSESYDLRNFVWSPDSNKFVYAKDSLTGVDLWYYDFSKGQEIQITQNNAMNLYPAWSYDGQKIAYVTNELCKNELDGCQNLFWWDIATYSLSAHNSNPNIITNFAQSELIPNKSIFVSLLCDLKWSNDDQFIAFANDCETFGLKWYRNVYVASTDGANQWQVTNFNQYDETATRLPDNLFTVSYEWLDDVNALWLGYSEDELKEGGEIRHDSVIVTLADPNEKPEMLTYSNVPHSSGTVWSPQKQYILWHSRNQAIGLQTSGNRPRVSEYDKNVFSELDFDSPLPFGSCYQEFVSWPISEQFVAYISDTNSGFCDSPNTLESAVVVIDLDKRIHKTILTTDDDIQLLGWTTFN